MVGANILVGLEVKNYGNRCKIVRWIIKELQSSNFFY